MLCKNSIIRIALATSLVLLIGCETTPAPVGHEDTEDDRTVGKHVLNCVEVSGHHVYKSKMTCPLGGEEFEALILGTHTTFGVSLDWESLSYMRFPVPLPVCPSNGFIIIEEGLADMEVDRISAAVESAEYQSLYAQRHAT